MPCPPAMPPRRIHETEEKYYADGEDAYGMRKLLGTQPAPVAADGEAASGKGAAAGAAAKRPTRRR